MFQPSGTKFRRSKLEIIRYNTVKVAISLAVTCLGPIPGRDRQTDRQTDGRTDGHNYDS